VTENKKKEKIWENVFYVNLNLKGGLGINLQPANASWYQRKRWHNLPYMTQIATLPAKHCYWRHNVGHAENIYYQRILL